MTRLHNWSDTHTFRAARIHRPDSIDAVQRIVAASSKARAIGTRHSFNDIADTLGDLIDTSAIDLPLVIDRERSTVTVAAATRYGPLAERLQSQGHALHNMASLPHISVAGATATATHGSGNANGSLATAVAAVELVTASGDLVEIKRGDPDFDGVVVGLGAFGIITRLTLDIQPSFDLQQDAYEGLAWDTLLNQTDTVMGGAYSVSLMTLWSTRNVGRMWRKTRLVPGQDFTPPSTFLGATGVAPEAAGSGAALDARLTTFGSPGPWSDRLTHFRLVTEPGALEQIQSEYIIPRDRAREALTFLRSIGPRIDEHLMMSEIRSVAADTHWLSMSEGHDALCLHFTWKQEPHAVGSITAEIEDMLLPLDARPHWAKMIHAPAARLASLYPRMDTFRALATRYDPSGKFRNAYLDRHVFG